MAGSSLTIVSRHPTRWKLWTFTFVLFVFSVSALIWFIFSDIDDKDLWLRFHNGSLSCLKPSDAKKCEVLGRLFRPALSVNGVTQIRLKVLLKQIQPNFVPVLFKNNQRITKEPESMDGIEVHFEDPMCEAKLNTLQDTDWFEGKGCVGANERISFLKAFPEIEYKETEYAIPKIPIGDFEWIRKFVESKMINNSEYNVYFVRNGIKITPESFENVLIRVEKKECDAFTKQNILTSKNIENCLLSDLLESIMPDISKISQNKNYLNKIPSSKKYINAKLQNHNDDMKKDFVFLLQKNEQYYASAKDIDDFDGVSVVEESAQLGIPGLENLHAFLNDAKINQVEISKELSGSFGSQINCRILEKLLKNPEHKFCIHDGIKGNVVFTPDECSVPEQKLILTRYFFTIDDFNEKFQEISKTTRCRDVLNSLLFDFLKSYSVSNQVYFHFNDTLGSAQDLINQVQQKKIESYPFQRYNNASEEVSIHDLPAFEFHRSKLSKDFQKTNELEQKLFKDQFEKSLVVLSRYYQTYFPDVSCGEKNINDFLKCYSFPYKEISENCTISETVVKC